MKISKFGGSSVSDAAQIKKILSIMNEDPERHIAVVSAPGKRYKDDIKVTDLLIDIYHDVMNGHPYHYSIEAVIERFRTIEQELPLNQTILPDLNHQLESIVTTQKNKPERLLDALKSCGENFNAQLIARFNDEQGVPTVYLSPKDIQMYVTDEPGNAMIITDSYQQIAAAIAAYPYHKIIIPGFFGISINHDIVTFSRGGSDLTGAIIARAVEADIYENFTDVSGIFSANPLIINQPQKIDELTYDEMRELSYAGFKVFHDEAIAPLISKSIPVVIKNTNDPQAAGTRIVAKRAPKGVIGVSCDKGFASINMKKYLMNRELGFTRKLLSILEEMNISYDHMPSGIDNISIVLRADQLNDHLNLLLERIERELNVDELDVEHHLAILMIVGEGMKTAIGTANKATTALANHQVNLKMINQGSSEISMMFGIDETDAEKATQAVYQAFFT